MDSSDVELWLLNSLIGHEILEANAGVVQLHGFEAALSSSCTCGAATAVVSSAVSFEFSAVVVSMI